MSGNIFLDACTKTINSQNNFLSLLNTVLAIITQFFKKGLLRDIYVSLLTLFHQKYLSILALLKSYSSQLLIVQCDCFSCEGGEWVVYLFFCGLWDENRDSCNPSKSFITKP